MRTHPAWQAGRARVCAQGGAHTLAPFSLPLCFFNLDFKNIPSRLAFKTQIEFNTSSKSLRKDILIFGNMAFYNKGALLLCLDML
jgi:hypothetical protein